MNSFRVFLLDDDQIFLSEFGCFLKKYLKTLPYSFSIHSFTDSASLSKEATQLKPDLIIADIQLADNDQNGIGLLKELQKSGCDAQIIFLTGYLEYAPDIFSLHPLYFILKSEFEKRLPEAINAFVNVMERQNTTLHLTIGRTVEHIPVSDILYIERVLRKTVIHCLNRNIRVSYTLGDIAQDLPKRQFSFSHQSILVHLKYIKSYGKSEVTITNNDILPISRSHVDDFRNAIASYLSEYFASF